MGHGIRTAPGREREGRYRMLTIARRYNEIAERAVERLKAIARGTLPDHP
jgi:hypothetical protein